MTTLTTVPTSPRALDVSINEDSLTIFLEDGRVVSAPTTWYPRLAHARHTDLRKWELIGHGIHWPELDEDISVENLILGQPSTEGSKSFSRWVVWYSSKSTEQDAANP